MKPWLINSLNNNFILIKLLEKQLEKQIMIRHNKRILFPNE